MGKDWGTKILDLCRSEQISSAEASDAMRDKADIIVCTSIQQGNYRAGFVQQIRITSLSNWEIHQCACSAKADCIVVIRTAVEDTSMALVGSLIARFLIQERKVYGIVIDGAIRDIADMRLGAYPIWYKGISPKGVSNERGEDPDIELSTTMVISGLAICDDDGVCIISDADFNEDTFSALARTRYKETMWQYCLDKLKWTTKKIVCESEYSDIEAVAQREALEPSIISKITELKDS